MIFFQRTTPTTPRLIIQSQHSVQETVAPLAVLAPNDGSRQTVLRAAAFHHSRRLQQVVRT